MQCQLKISKSSYYSVRNWYQIPKTSEGQYGIKEKQVNSCIAYQI